jgi:hypothetical protein
VHEQPCGQIEAENRDEEIRRLGVVHGRSPHQHGGERDVADRRRSEQAPLGPEEPRERAHEEGRPDDDRHVQELGELVRLAHAGLAADPGDAARDRVIERRRVVLGRLVLVRQAEMVDQEVAVLRVRGRVVACERRIGGRVPEGDEPGQSGEEEAEALRSQPSGRSDPHGWSLRTSQEELSDLVPNVSA